MEKRRFTRIGFNMAAELTVNEQHYSFAQVGNLSVGGCLLETAEMLPAGASCRFWLPLEPTDPTLGVEVFGEIIRCDGETISVRFTRIDPESLFHLQNIIRYNAPDPDRVENEISKHLGLV
ncbi:MAG: PilZ domain-containing protein [Desulfobulbaceae bacterium]|jgi:hypothetical protein|nr:PilZ domain-containing protein [Desulfobulbaceae bacterium]